MWEIISHYKKNQSKFYNIFSLLFCLLHKRVAEKVTTGEKIKLSLSHMPALTRAGQLNFRAARGLAFTHGECFELQFVLETDDPPLKKCVKKINSWSVKKENLSEPDSCGRVIFF